MAERRRWPLPNWLIGYQRQDALADSAAALIVTVMLIPQSLAYAMLAGVPAQVGLYASILPLIAYALIGSSRTLSVGPVAVASLMSASAIGRVAESGSAGYLEATIALALLSGLLLLLMAVLRLGWITSLLSHPVVIGFISASGVLIAASQLRHLLGVPIHGDTLVEMAPGLSAALTGLHLPTLLLGGGGLLLLLGARSALAPLLQRLGMQPASAALLARTTPALVVLASALLVAWLRLDQQGVAVVGAVPAGLPNLALPAVNPTLWQQLWLPALLISLIGFVESVSVAQTLAARRRQRIAPNRELAGLGAANIASALSGGLAVSGGFSRSVVNFDAGAITPLASILTALAIALVTLLLTDGFAWLPQAALAATIIVAVLSLIDLRAMGHVWRYSKSDASAMLLTIAGVLLAGVEAGVLLGVASSLLLYLWRTGTPHVAIIGQVPGTEHFRNVDRHQVLTVDGLLSVRVDESLYFANARFLEDRLYEMAIAQHDIRHVILQCSAINLIDASALDSLLSLSERLANAGVMLHLSEVKGPVMDALQNSHFSHQLSGQIFLSHYGAVTALSGTDGLPATAQSPSRS